MLVPLNCRNMIGESVRDSSSIADEDAITKRVALVALNLLTAFAAISVWCGVWVFLDGLRVPAIKTGVFAALAVLSLGTLRSHCWLEWILEKWRWVPNVPVVSLWTWCLAILSILIHRAGFRITYAYLLMPHDNLLALVLASFGCVSLLLAARFRSAGVAVPVETVADSYDSGFRFVPASFSADDQKQGFFNNLMASTLDLFLTISFVLVWACVWIIYDNLKVPYLISLLIASLCISIITFSRAELHLLEAVAGMDNGIGVVALALWNGLLTMLVILAWRGLWDLSVLHFGLVKDPRRPLILCTYGTIILATIGRLRSLLFPPVIFSLDGAAELRKALLKSSGRGQPAASAVSALTALDTKLTA